MLELEIDLRYQHTGPSTFEDVTKWGKWWGVSLAPTMHVMCKQARYI